jgi:hypothetical protein
MTRKLEPTPGFEVTVDYKQLKYEIQREKDYEGNSYIVEKRLTYDVSKNFQGVPEFVTVKGKQKTVEFYFIMREDRTAIYRPTSQELSRSPELGGYRVRLNF